MKNITNFIICCITLSFIILFFYLRITRKTPLIAINSSGILEYYTYFLVLFIVSLGLFFLLVFAHIFKHYVKKRTLVSQPFLLNFVLLHKKFDIFYKTYGIIFDSLSPHYTVYLIGLTKRFLDCSKKTKLTLVFLFAVLPRVLVVIMLLYDLYNNMLYYYFYALLLLLIPLIFNFFVFVLKDIGPRLLPEFKKFIEWDFSNDQEINLKTSTGIKKAQAVQLKFKPEYTDKDLDHFLHNFYYPLLFIEPEMNLNFIPKYTKITTITLFVYIGVHILCWGYLLFFVIYV